MQKLHLDYEKIKRSRKYAKAIIADLKVFMDQHTTSSIERANLRMLGIDGINQFDVPLVNVVVDHIIKDADLSKGALHYIAHIINETNLTPQEIAYMINEGKIDLKPYKDYPKCQCLDVLKPYIDISLERMKSMKKIRQQWMKDDDVKTLPYLYVIVATGNIYEDITQAKMAAEQGADIIAVIRSTGQSLLDYVPYGPTTEGFGGTYATQENFKLMRSALDEVSQKEGRYIRLVNYASGLCMPEIAVMGAFERLDMMLNDALYGIIFRDINMKRTLVDQYYSRVISAFSDITINTGEDNYLTTADAYQEAHTVLASQFINEAFAFAAHMQPHQIGLGHAYEIDPKIEDSFLYELAQAMMIRQIFPEMPLKYMPPTKHITGDIFDATLMNTCFNIASVWSKQSIHLLGMMTEAIHTPFLSDRALAIQNALKVQQQFKHLYDEVIFKPAGKIEMRANQVLNDASELLEKIHQEGLFKTLEMGRFADIKRHPNQGKGLSGVFMKHSDYQNPILDMMIKSMEINV